MGALNFAGIEISYLQWLQKGVFNIISPLAEYLTYGYNSIISFWNGLINADDIVEENNELKKKVAGLKREIRGLKSSLRQNMRLEKLTAFLDAFRNFSEYEVTGATVIGYGPSSWQNKIMINKGASDGLKNKMPVISYNGILVGRISEVGAHTSQVILINNPDFAVGGIVQSSRAVGLVKGKLNNRDINIMDKIQADAEIKKGDRILTSGLSNNYPKYLPIGEVVKVASDNYGISKKAEIKLFLSNYTLEEVLIITEFSRGEVTVE